MKAKRDGIYHSTFQTDSLIAESFASSARPESEQYCLAVLFRERKGGRE